MATTVDEPPERRYRGHRAVPRRRVPRSVLAAGLAVLVSGALVAIVLSGPDSPSHPGLGAVPPPAPVGGDDAGSTPTEVTPSASRVTRSPSRSASPSPSPVISASTNPSPSPSPSRVLPAAVTYEAEAGSVSAGARVAAMDGASDGRGVYAIGAPNLGTLTVTGISAPVTGPYTVTIYYQDPGSTSRVVLVSIDGGPTSKVETPVSGSCCVRTRVLNVTWTGGTTHTVAFSNPDARAPDIDRVVVAGA